MPTHDGDRAKYFPAIEKKHGGPISLWMDRIRDLESNKYPDQIAYLREEHGFSQAHANAVVMYVRGSKSAKRHDSPDAYFSTIDKVSAATMKNIVTVIQKKFPKLELVIAWNQPIVRMGKHNVFGMSASRSHLTINPFSVEVLNDHEEKLGNFVINKYTFQIPTDWKPNASLLNSMVKQRLNELQD